VRGDLLRSRRVGLALSGGSVRGLAHIGVVSTPRITVGPWAIPMSSWHPRSRRPATYRVPAPSSWWSPRASAQRGESW